MFKSPTRTKDRSSKGAKSIRGNISAPIPVSNSQDDDEFPIRRPGTGVASVTPIDAEEMRKVKAQLQPMPQHLQMHQALTTASASIPDPPFMATRHTNPTQAEATSPDSKHTTPQKPAVLTERNSPPVALRHPRVSVSATQRLSTVSGLSTSNTVQSGKPQRKKSTLRSAFSKLFGRKKRETSQGSASELDGKLGFSAKTQHHSIPAPRNQSRDGHNPRAASLPVTEFDRALRSHSIGPNDITAIISARNSTQIENGHSREQSAPMIMSTNVYTEIRRGGDEWTGLSPRPASMHGRGRSYTEGTHQPSDIGIAITSDLARDVTRSRRRSRSLSGMLGVVDIGQESKTRSDEIRYWRASYGGVGVPLSPMSTTTDVDETWVEEPSEVRKRSFSIPQGQIDTHTPPRTPPNHHFGPGSAITVDDVAESHLVLPESTKLVVGSVEARLQRIEQILERIYTLPSVESITPETTPPPISGARLHPAAAQKPAFGYSDIGSPGRLSIHQATSRDSMMVFDSQIPTASIPSQYPAGPRPGSGSTIRAASSMPHLPPGPRTKDSMANLIAQLEIERCARQSLEIQLTKLSERVNTLSTTLYTMMHNTTGASNGSRGIVVQTPVKSMTGPRANLRPVITQTLTPPRDEDGHPAAGERTPTGGISAVTPSHLAPLRTLHSIGSAKAHSSASVFEDSDASPVDVYETPGEGILDFGGRGEMNGVGHDADDDDDDKENMLDANMSGRKGPRTLSLSQMTLGKGTGNGTALV